MEAIAKMMLLVVVVQLMMAAIIVDTSVVRFNPRNCITMLKSCTKSIDFDEGDQLKGERPYPLKFNLDIGDDCVVHVKRWQKFETMSSKDVDEILQKQTMDLETFRSLDGLTTFVESMVNATMDKATFYAIAAILGTDAIDLDGYEVSYEGNMEEFPLPTSQAFVDFRHQNGLDTDTGYQKLRAALDARDPIGRRILDEVDDRDQWDPVNRKIVAPRRGKRVATSLSWAHVAADRYKRVHGSTNAISFGTVSSQTLSYPKEDRNVKTLNENIKQDVEQEKAAGKQTASKSLSKRNPRAPTYQQKFLDEQIRQETEFQKRRTARDKEFHEIRKANEANYHNTRLAALNEKMEKYDAALKDISDQAKEMYTKHGDKLAALYSQELERRSSQKKGLGEGHD